MLILGIFTQSIGRLILLSNYLINKEFITLNYCVNKSKPKLKCNGKCHLKKQLKAQEKQENNSKSDAKNLDEVQFCLHYANISSPQIAYTLISINSEYLNRKIGTISDTIFHPPKI